MSVQAGSRDQNPAKNIVFCWILISISVFSGLKICLNVLCAVMYYLSENVNDLLTVFLQLNWQKKNVSAVLFKKLRGGSRVE